MKMFSFLKKQLKGSDRTAIIKKNILSSLIIKGFSIIISLLLVPLTLGYVSSELYGIWLTLSSIMLWLGFFDIGFTLGLKNKLTEAIALHQMGKGKALVSTTYFMMLLIFLPICLLLEILVPYVDWSVFLNVSSIYNKEITLTLHALIAFFCIQMVLNVISAVISAYQQVALASALTVIGNFVSLITIFLLTKFVPPSLVVLAFAISAVPIVVTFSASFILFSKRFKEVSPSFKFIEKKYVKDIFSLGLKFFIIQIQFVVLYQFTNILISNVSGPNDVTSYNIAYKYLGIAMMIYSIILSPLWPAFTDAYTKGDFGWMNHIYKKMTRVYSLCVIVLIIMVGLSPIVYGIWIGEKAAISTYITIGVAVYMIIYNWTNLQVNLINGIGTIKLQTYVTFIGLFLHIPVSLFLGQNLHLGALGVICSMILINLIYAVVFTIQIRKILGNKAIGIWIR